MKKNRLSTWCDRTWIKVGCIITMVVVLMVLFNWEAWSTELKIVASVAALIPIHVIEEWVFPGGFHYQYNSLFRSTKLDQYPMCRLSDMITNFGTTILFIILTVICIWKGKVDTGILLAIIVFSVLEVIFHTSIGTYMYFKFNRKGKTTIYGPGSITAYHGFFVLGVISLYCVNDRLIVAYDWIVCFIILIIIAIGLILVPETLIKKDKAKDYPFESHGYFDKYL